MPHGETPCGFSERAMVTGERPVASHPSIAGRTDNNPADRNNNTNIPAARSAADNSNLDNKDRSKTARTAL